MADGRSCVFRAALESTEREGLERPIVVRRTTSRAHTGHSFTNRSIKHRGVTTLSGLHFLASVRIHWSALGSVWSRRVPPQGRATQYLTSPCWGPATKGGGLGLDQLGRPRARRQASTPRGLAASPKGIAPQTREREELTIRRALRTSPLSQERVGGESEEPAQPECWRGRRAWRGHRAGTAPGQEEQRESCRSSTQRARPRGTRNVLGRTSRPECSRRKIREDWQEG